MSEKKKAEKKDAASRKTATNALLVEFEGVLVAGRPRIYEIVAETMSGTGVKLTPPLFSRYCLDRTPRQYVVSLLRQAGQPEQAVDALATEIGNRTTELFQDKSMKLAAGMRDVLDMAVATGLAVGVLSDLPDKTLRGVAANLGLGDAVELVSFHTEQKGFPSADAWLMLAKSLLVKPTRCLAMVSSAQSCHAALAAHFRCVALPDAFSGFQDFGGSDCILETLDAKSIADLFESGGRS